MLIDNCCMFPLKASGRGAECPHLSSSLQLCLCSYPLLPSLPFLALEASIMIQTVFLPNIQKRQRRQDFAAHIGWDRLLFSWMSKQPSLHNVHSWTLPHCPCHGYMQVRTHMHRQTDTQIHRHTHCYLQWGLLLLIVRWLQEQIKDNPSYSTISECIAEFPSAPQPTWSLLFLVIRLQKRQQTDVKFSLPVPLSTTKT